MVEVHRYVLETNPHREEYPLSERRLGIFLMLTATFSSLSWILLTFLSAFAVVFNVIPSTNSIFSNPIFIAALAIPYAITLFSAVWALKLQNLMTKRNLMLIPVMCYTEVSMVTLSSLGFFYGVFDRTGFFHYRTPKSGSAKEKDSKTMQYFRGLANDRNAIVEGGAFHRRDCFGRPRAVSWYVVPVNFDDRLRCCHVKVHELDETLEAATNRICRKDRAANHHPWTIPLHAVLK